MTGVPMAAALAGVPAGVQAQGVWAGRRQLFVRFAGEAETATMYTSVALSREIERQVARSTFHSISIGGRDPLANSAFLLSAFAIAKPTLPMMLDTDGQRPDALAPLAPHLALTQVTIEFVGQESMVTRALETLRIAAELGGAHALVLCPREETPDGQVLRLVEQAHSASAAAQVVIQAPLPAGDQALLDRRWAVLLDRATAAHADTQLALRLPPPAGLR